MLHFRPVPGGDCLTYPSMKRPDNSSSDSDTGSSMVQRIRVASIIAGYAALVLAAWYTGNDALSALCVVLLISAVLAPSLRRFSRAAWAAWILLVGSVVALTFSGHGRTALDLVPLAINLGLAYLFGISLTGTHTPLISRAIIAIEGAERLALPRVAGYARMLTLAWTVVFLVQVLLFVVLMFWWLPRLAIDSPAHAWAMTWLHVGGYLLPAAFMVIEYAFRRWYLRHLPHVPAREFAQQLIRNWPQLLRDSDLRAQRTP
jgi:hypothetical protein